MYGWQNLVHSSGKRLQSLYPLREAILRDTDSAVAVLLRLVMKSATPVLLEKDRDLSAVSAREESRKAGPKDHAARVTDAALERIVRRSRTAPARPKTNNVAAMPVGDDDAEPLSALFRAAAARNPHRSKLSARIALWSVALGVGAAAFLTGALLGRNGAHVPPDLLLQSTDSHGTLVIRWNYKALQNLDRATLYIDDGGRFMTIPLNHPRLVSGYFPYPRKFSLVTVTMVAGDRQAVTSFAAHPQRLQVSHRDSANP
jgi:hypothetical protein